MSARTLLTRPSVIRLGSLLLVAVTFVAVSVAADKPASRVDFNRHVRPLLSDNCFRCHGPDATTREADLRLDQPDQLTVARDGVVVLVPGRPGASELIRRLITDDPDQRMPPPDSGKSLSGEQIETLRRWIEQGGEWAPHWSFVPPRRPDSSAVATTTTTNPVDSLIDRQLAARGLAPAAAASKEVLIRRLSLDLRGLPPSPEEVAAFTSDHRPDAFAHLANRYLDDPHYGERMAQQWLDLVRFADTVGYHGDQPVSVWPYRDYVIEAFNENLPFDQFTREQLAGDLLPRATVRQQVAAGFNRLNRMTAEGGAQPKEYLVRYAADRVRTTSSTWLGVTLGCAECHDHKFDPLSTRDFYSFAAFFADIQEKGFYGNAHVTGDWGPTVRIFSASQQRELSILEERLATVRQTLTTPTPALTASRQAWEVAGGPPASDWRLLRPLTASSNADLNVHILEDGSVFVTRGTARSATYTLELAVELDSLTAVRIEALADDRLPERGPGLSDDGAFTLHEVVIQAHKRLSPITAMASSNLPAFPAEQAIDGNPATGWSIPPRSGTDHSLIIQLQPHDIGPGSTQLTIQLRQTHGESHMLGRFRISATGVADPILVEQQNHPDLKAILGVPEQHRTEEQIHRMDELYRSFAPELDEARQELKRLEKAKTDVIAQAPTMLATISTSPRAMRILPRGNWMDESGPVVEPAVPAYFGSAGLPGDRRLNRLDLANWLVSRGNPLTARVFVNRLWRMLFGVGLTQSMDDLGAQGGSPEQLDLLDWLAVEFMESGWDVKHLIRVIVNTRAYQRASEPTADLAQRDPENRFFGRQGRFRLDAEFVRDNALAISGLLVDQLGGPSAKPYQPAGYYSQLNFPKREYVPDEGPNQYRRGVYTHWQRTFLHPSLQTFDAPTREECVAERSRSNTPLQSLVLLNDPSYVEASGALALRLIRRSADPRQRLTYAFQLATGRSPSDDECDVLLSFVTRRHGEFLNRPREARRLLDTCRLELPRGFDEAEVAAWILVARVVFNLHETVTRN